MGGLQYFFLAPHCEFSCCDGGGGGVGRPVAADCLYPAECSLCWLCIFPAGPERQSRLWCLSSFGVVVSGGGVGISSGPELQSVYYSHLLFLVMCGMLCLCCDVFVL